MNKGVLEGLLFVTGEDGLTIDEISNLLEISANDTKELLNQFEQDLKNSDRGLKLVYLGNKYKLATKEEHKMYYERLTDQVVSSTITQAALEVLVIIAYNAPISVGMIDEIRGVASRDMVRKLLFRGLIEVAGRSDMPGKPMVYKTTDKFLDYFNLSSIDELPELKIPEEISEEEKDLFISRYKENE